MFDFLSQLEFRHPLLLATILACVPVYLLARRAPGTVVFSSLSSLPDTGASWRMKLSWLPDVALALAAAGLGLAAAGPQIADPNSRIHREGIAIVMVMDISGSMEALDMSTETEERTRLDAARSVFEEFVVGGEGLRGRPDDAIGIVSFARYADTRSPLTLDHEMVIQISRQLEIVTDDEENATAIGDGLALAVERLRESPARSRIAIVLTDGVNNAGEETPLSAAELARTKGIRVYTIGAGTNGVAPVRRGGVLVPRPVEIDEETLREIADLTGGRYFRATDAESLHAIYEEIDDLERTELIEERFTNYHEYFDVVLAIALLIACFAWLGRGTVLRRLP